MGVDAVNRDFLKNQDRYKIESSNSLNYEAALKFFPETEEEAMHIRTA
jgi:hypothetical protein